MRSTATTMIVTENDYVGGPVLAWGGGSEDPVTVRRVQIEGADPEVAAVWGEKPGYVARVFLSATPPCTLSRSGTALQVPARGVSETAFWETGAGYMWPILYPIDVVKFEMPEAALARWAHDARRIKRSRLNLRSGSSAEDNAFLAFGHAAIHCLENPDRVSQFFVDHLLDGACAYLFHAFGDTAGVVNGGLAPWQARRAKDLIESRLSSDLTLEELAQECGLSVAHFTRAFRRSIGESPHQWLLRRRTDQAQWLLINTDKQLAEISADCGFFDQSHFTNVFRRRIGVSPGAFRREHAHLSNRGNGHEAGSPGSRN